MAGQPKTKKNSVSSGKVKKTKMSEAVINDVIKDECQQTCEEKEKKQEERRNHAFASNKLRLESLISDDCFLSDIELAISPPPVAESKLPSATYVRTMDGGVDRALKDDYMDEEDRKRVESYYMRGVKQALKHVSDIVGDDKLISHIISCQKVIALLLQDTATFVSAVETIDAAEMAARVSYYFDDCDKRRRSYTVPGLAYTIGFMHRKQMLQFASEHQDELTGYIVARALMRIEDQRNIEIISGGGLMSGHKLDLATNFDWNDAKAKPQKEESTTNITQNIINMNSLPPTSMTVEEWQAQFLSQQSKPALDVTPEKK